MPRVICDLPNASDEISGVKFHPLEEGGKISDEISVEQAEVFSSIPGYTIDADEREPVKVEVKPAPKTRAKKAPAAVEPEAPAPEPQPDPVEGFGVECDPPPDDTVF